jgi:hypothetical protein
MYVCMQVCVYVVYVEYKCSQEGFWYVCIYVVVYVEYKRFMWLRRAFAMCACMHAFYVECKRYVWLRRALVCMYVCSECGTRYLCMNISVACG